MFGPTAGVGEEASSLLVTHDIRTSHGLDRPLVSSLPALPLDCVSLLRCRTTLTLRLVYPDSRAPVSSSSVHLGLLSLLPHTARSASLLFFAPAFAGSLVVGGIDDVVCTYVLLCVWYADDCA